MATKRPTSKRPTPRKLRQVEVSAVEPVQVDLRSGLREVPLPTEQSVFTSHEEAAPPGGHPVLWGLVAGVLLAGGAIAYYAVTRP